jgi:predicted transcriptional regulator
MKIQAKVFLPGDVARALDEVARRTRRSKSEIMVAALASYLSPDSAEATEAAVTRRLDRMSRQIERLERDVVISNEAVALFVRTWLRNAPSMSSPDNQAAIDMARERYARFVETLARRLSTGKLLREEVAMDHAGEIPVTNQEARGREPSK